MTLHKLTAGDGYTYLTRQVAAHDGTERGQAGLGEYYAEQGESPGRWLGAGLKSLGLSAGGVVTQQHMVALFGHGQHPRSAELPSPMPLGRPFPTYEATTLRKEVANASSLLNRTHGRPWNAPLTVDERARLRTQVATRMFTQQHGRRPLDARELAGFLARASRPPASPVAGYDLTFSPVKSVSVMWALAARPVAEEIAAAHHAAVADTIRWLENEVAFTRLGRSGVRQVPVRGLVATAFTHRDSRAGDPDLHTHVAVSNKVQTLAADGDKWLALDGRVLFKAKVAASERYNTRLEAELTHRLGVRFVDQPSSSGRRPIREIDGISPLLMQHWSSQRRAIERRQGELSADFLNAHGRPPTPIESAALAQQANLETREAKHQPRSEADQRQRWRAEALEILADPDWVEAVVPGALGRRREARAPTAAWVATTASTVVTTLQETRAVWQVWHVRAEAERQARKAAVPLEHLDTVIEAVTRTTLHERSVRLEPQSPVPAPAALRRPDGSSVYEVHGAARFTSRRILDDEAKVLPVASLRGGRVVSEARVGIALAEVAANGRALDPSQAAMVGELATSGRRLQVALAPAGSGKTTALRVLAEAWRDSGGTVVGLAPSAAAADQLRDAINDTSDTLAKLTHSLTSDRGDELPWWVQSIGPKSLVVIDEAGMAATPDLAAAVDFIVARGGSIRLIGDDRQLAAVAAGGLLRDLVHDSGAATLDRLHRFTHPAEAAATLAIRGGDSTALGYYADHQRIHAADPGSATDQAYRAWQHDRQHGYDSLLLAPTHDLVNVLNQRARADRLASTYVLRDGGPGREAELRDGLRASAGDVIVTRRNDRRIRVRATDWVKNGDRWRVIDVHPGGSITATRLGNTAHPAHVLLPAEYVSQHVQLGYAATVHTAQGTTVDTTHTVLAGSETRQTLYVALTRGRHQNHLYLADATDPELQHFAPNSTAPSPDEVLASILSRDGAQESATTVHRRLHDPTTQLPPAVLRYQDALGHAAEQVLGAPGLSSLDLHAEQLIPGLTTQDAYPTLRQQLALRALAGENPTDLLRAATFAHELHSADDIAAVLDWRLRGSAGTDGPLRWLPPVPEQLAHDPEWGNYLNAASAHVEHLAEETFSIAADWTPEHAPSWAQGLTGAHHAALRGDLATWRAAFAIPDHDPRPTGPPQPVAAAEVYQRDLERRHATAAPRPRTGHDWSRHLPEAVLRDPHRAGLWTRLDDLSTKRNDADQLVATALADARPLPIEHPAGALWWRVVAAAKDIPNTAPPVPTRRTQPADALPPTTIANTRGSAQRQPQPTPRSSRRGPSRGR